MRVPLIIADSITMVCKYNSREQALVRDDRMQRQLEYTAEERHK